MTKQNRPSIQVLIILISKNVLTTGMILKERIDDWYDFELRSGVNWALDPFESDNDDEDGEHFDSEKILNHIFKTLELN